MAENLMSAHRRTQNFSFFLGGGGLTLRLYISLFDFKNYVNESLKLSELISSRVTAEN